jgi:hypothetical protein
MRTIGLAAVLIAALCAGCQESTVVNAPDPELSHPNGLRVGRPSGFLESQTAAGYELLESGDVRSPRTIEVELAGAPPTLEVPEDRELPDGGIARFSLREIGAGSAGPEFELSAVKEAGERWIVVTAIAQSESGEPDFDPAWRVVDSARLAE